MNKYPTYKPSNIPWLGYVPEHWGKATVKKLFHIGRGRVIAATEMKKEGLYPVFSSQTKRNGCMGYLDTFDFDCSQITWTTDGANAGTIFLREGKHNCTNVCGTLLPKINNKYKLRYLYYVLFSIVPNYKRKDTNGYKIMNKEMSLIPVLLPPLPEQTQIVRYLDWQVSRINKLISAKKKQIALLKEQKQAKINYELQITNYEKTPLKRVCFINASISEKLKLYSHEDIVTFLPMEKISVDGKIDCSEKRKIQDVRSGFTSFAKNDVVIAKITPCFENGKGACLYELDTEIGFGTTEFIVLRAKENLLPQYLYLITRTSNFRKQGAESMTGSAGQKRVPTSFVANFQIAIPSISEQQKIITNLDNITAKIDLAIDY
jgi:type I restriction enzyme S subunit